ncbi:MAG: hypothetical protein J7578_18720, partial [Chitinophagaceae bacterium]|nr:hypothetical protein [Chitinophagaceae bacterium]
MSATGTCPYSGHFYVCLQSAWNKVFLYALTITQFMAINYDAYELVAGLEVHAQLLTNSKLF